MLFKHMKYNYYLLSCLGNFPETTVKLHDNIQIYREIKNRTYNSFSSHYRLVRLLFKYINKFIYICYYWLVRRLYEYINLY